MFYVYLITNNANKKRYVGITQKTLELRFREHAYAATKRASTCALHCAIRKYGVKLFSIEVLSKHLVRHVAIRQEIKNIKTLSTHISTGQGYNQTIGGDGAFGYKHSDERKLKISKALKGKTLGRKTPLDIKLRLQKSPKNKAVIQLDLQGNIVGDFPSIRSAARNVGFIDHSQISRCCTGTRGAKIAGGYMWKFKKDHRVPSEGTHLTYTESVT